MNQPSLVSQSQSMQTVAQPQLTRRVSVTLSPINLSNLSERLVGDVLIAASVTFAVSPFLTVIDKAIVQRSAGTQSILSSAANSLSGMIRQPVTYVKSPTFLWMWATYASTYAAANSLRTLCEHREYAQASRPGVQSTTTGASRSTATLFLGTTLVNSSASMLKDRAYARLFGNAVTKVPIISYGLWMTRDLTVIGSSFVLPSMVSARLSEFLPAQQAQTVAQIATPLAAQLIAGPLHLIGLDCCNRSVVSSSTLGARVADRLGRLAGSMGPVVAARMARILPGYGFAGVANTEGRNRWREYLIQRKIMSGMQGEFHSDLVALIRAKTR